MRKMLHNRRGSIAFATVIALIPLIGAIALGAEAGSWYVTKQHAQNAADAAAYSGALTLACANAGGVGCNSTQDYVYRGKQFAAQNSFCNAGDTGYTGATCPVLSIGTAQSVAIDQPTSDSVRATISQTQPAYLAALLGLSTVTIGASAIAEVTHPNGLCMLGLNSTGSALTIGGSSTITGNGCGLMSDGSVKYNSTPNFSGSGWSVNATSGCIASAGHCAIGWPYNYNMLPAANPLKVLDTESFNSRKSPSTKPCGGNVTNGNTCALVDNSANGVYSDLKVNSGGTVNFAPGTYFFYNATITFGGTVTGTDVTFVLLGNSSLTINSGSVVNLSAPKTNTFSSDLNGILIDDQSNGAVKNSGGSTVALGGTMYFPKADVTWNGNTANANTTCTQVVANTITISGNTYMSTQDCDPGTIAHTQVVRLVQ
jgi:hypothetical protein